VLDYCTFYGTRLKKTTFTGCSLKETDFTEADLSASVFDKCDLLNAKFSNTILEKTDFRTAVNFSIDPQFNKMKKARFTTFGLTGLLDKYNLDIEQDF
jgi:fluoroquinolone resistance protein